MEKVVRRMSSLICRMRVTLCVCVCVCVCACTCAHKFRAEKQKEVFNYMCPNLNRKVTGLNKR